VGGGGALAQGGSCCFSSGHVPVVRSARRHWRTKVGLIKACRKGWHRGCLLASPREKELSGKGGGFGVAFWLLPPRKGCRGPPYSTICERGGNPGATEIFTPLYSGGVPVMSMMSKM